jgi:hypothetical protein
MARYESNNSKIHELDSFQLENWVKADSLVGSKALKQNIIFRHFRRFVAETLGAKNGGISEYAKTVLGLVLNCCGESSE